MGSYYRYSGQSDSEKSSVASLPPSYASVMGETPWISVIGSGATTRQNEATIEAGRASVTEGDPNGAGSGDPLDVIQGDAGDVGRGDLGGEGDDGSGLPSYLQAVAGEEEGAWLNIGYQP